MLVTVNVISSLPPVSLPTTTTLVDISTLSANTLDWIVNVEFVLIVTLLLSSFGPTGSAAFAIPLPSPIILAASELISVTVYPNVSLPPFLVVRVITCWFPPSYNVTEVGLGTI